MSLSLPKAVLFDWDNTLVSTWRTSLTALNHTLKTMDLPLMTEDQYKTMPQHSVKDGFSRFFGEKSADATEIYYDYYRDNHLGMLAVLPGSQQLLDELHSNNVFMAIVSNKNGKILRKEIAFLDWDHYFGVTVGSLDLDVDKPHSKPALHALAFAQMAPSDQVLFVGDSLVDVACARAAGLKPVMVEPLDGNRPQDSDILHVADCLELSRMFGFSGKD